MIEIGKTYICRDQSLFTAEAYTEQGTYYRVQGVDQLGRVTWRSAKGRFDRHPHALDVVKANDCADNN